MTADGATRALIGLGKQPLALLLFTQASSIRTAGIAQVITCKFLHRETLHVRSRQYSHPQLLTWRRAFLSHFSRAIRTTAQYSTLPRTVQYRIQLFLTINVQTGLLGFVNIVMGAGEAHPSQIRVSCEICRKRKSRCRRLHVDDVRCAQCTMLGVECITGSQNKIGRPRRAPASGNKRSKQPSKSSPDNACTTPTAREQNRLQFIEASREACSFSEEDSPPDWTSVISTANIRESVLDMPANNPLITATAWPTMTIDFDSQALLPWGIMNYPNPMLADSNSSFDIIHSYALDTPINSPSTLEHSNFATVEPRPSSKQGCTTAKFDVTADSLVKLSKLNVELHTRMAAVEMHKSALNLDSFLYQAGALYIDNATVAEFMLRASQEFLQILAQLQNNRSTPSHRRALMMHTTFPELSPPLPSLFHENDCPAPVSPPSSCSDAPEPSLSAPLALTITSIFTQLICLYEVVLKHLTARIERIAIDPISPIPNLSSGGLPLALPCIQGMLFSDVAVHLLESIERILGISVARAGDDGNLLSARQRDVLWSELGGSFSVLSSHGAMRPATVRSTFKKVAGILEQISISAQN